MLFDHIYPYTNFHEMNLDWLLREIKRLALSMRDFESINAIVYGGTWSADKSYKKNTVVIYDGIGYLSLQAVPAGIPTDNGNYWLSVGAVTPESLGLIEEIEQITADMTALTGRVGQAEDDITDLQTAIDNISSDHATYHKTIYVAAASGSDLNDGSTQENAVQTLNKALEIMNKSAAGVYIRFIEAGAYIMSYPVVSGAMIHFLFDASNVTMYWLDASDDGWSKCFYSCYINMHGNPDGTSRWYLRGRNPAYLESGKITISNMTVDSDSNGAFGIIGGAIQSSDNVYNTHIYMSLSQGVFSNDTFASQSEYHSSALHIYNSSDVSMRGGVKFKDLDNNSTITNMISMTAATLRVLQDIILENTTHLSKRIYAASSQFLGGENRLISWLAQCNLERCMINEKYVSATTVWPVS